MTVRRFFRTSLLPLVTLGLCAGLAGRAAATLALSELEGPRQAPLTLAPAGNDRAPAPPSAAAIVARNLFCSDCPALASSGGPAADPVSLPAGATYSLDGYRLLATLVSPADPAHSLAVVERSSDGALSAVSVGGGGFASGQQAVRITPGFVEVRDAQGARALLYLDPQAQQAAANRASPRAAAPRAGAAPSDIRPLGPGRYQVRKAFVAELLARPSRFSRARVVPSVDAQGEPNGFRLARVPAGGPLAAAGFRSGDTITAISGHSVSTPEALLQVLTRVRNASHLTVSFSRGNRAMTVDYLIR